MTQASHIISPIHKEFLINTSKHTELPQNRCWQKNVQTSETFKPFIFFRSSLQECWASFPICVIHSGSLDSRTHRMSQGLEIDLACREQPNHPCLYWEESWSSSVHQSRCLRSNLVGEAWIPGELQSMLKNQRSSCSCLLPLCPFSPHPTPDFPPPCLDFTPLLFGSSSFIKPSHVEKKRKEKKRKKNQRSWDPRAAKGCSTDRWYTRLRSVGVTAGWFSPLKGCSTVQSKAVQEITLRCPQLSPSLVPVVPLYLWRAKKLSAFIQEFFFFFCYNKVFIVVCVFWFLFHVNLKVQNCHCSLCNKLTWFFFFKITTGSQGFSGKAVLMLPLITECKRWAVRSGD